jgi:hypothetical protein
MADWIVQRAASQSTGSAAARAVGKQRIIPVTMATTSFMAAPYILSTTRPTSCIDELLVLRFGIRPQMARHTTELRTRPLTSARATPSRANAFAPPAPVRRPREVTSVTI